MDERSSIDRVFSRIGLITVVFLVLALLGGVFLLGRFGADTPVDYKDDSDHFKYGSLGSEHEFGVPYWIWRALPSSRSAARSRPAAAGSICSA